MFSNAFNTTTTATAAFAAVPVPAAATPAMPLGAAMPVNHAAALGHWNRRLGSERTGVSAAEPVGDDDTQPHVLTAELVDTPLQLWNARTKRALSCGDRAPGSVVDTWHVDDASGRQRWVLGPAPGGACGEYNIRACDAAASPAPDAYLSAREHDPVVDIWSVDDASGRQRWKLRRESKNRYFVWLAGGRADAKMYLTATDANGITLDKLLKGDQQRRQLWHLALAQPKPPPASPPPPAAPAPPAPPAPGPAAKTRIPEESVSLLLDTIGLTYAQVDTILQLVSLPENGHPKWWTNYGYVEFLGDGRGYTATLFGACSGTGDLALILDQVGNIDPGHPLAGFADAVRRKRGDDVKGIEQVKTLIARAGDDPVWQRAVWRVYVDMYWKFAGRFADKQGDCADRPGPRLALPVSRGFVLDTAINHGADLESFQAILKKMPSPNEGDEPKWMQSFIDTRERILKSGYQSLDTSKTGDRCKLWSSLLRSGNTVLARPIAAYQGYWGKYTIS